MLALIVIVRAFECKSITGTKLEGSLSSIETRKINIRTNKINSDSSERKYIHLSNGLIQGYGICYTFTV